MSMDKSEKKKFMIVIGLSIILVTMAYFRFWHRKSSTAPDRTIVESSQPAQAEPQIAVDGQVHQQPDNGSGELALPAVKRDLFRPVKRPTFVADRPPKNSKPAEPEPAPDFRLGGTVVSNGESIAIINDRFLRTGDTIAAYRVVRIENDKVQLVSGTRKIELKMINNE